MGRLRLRAARPAPLPGCVVAVKSRSAGTFPQRDPLCPVRLCNNHCRLTVNQFSDGRKYIGGNRCERPVTKKSTAQDLNIYAVKRELLGQYKPVPGPRGKSGLPLALNMMELLPFCTPSSRSWASRSSPPASLRWKNTRKRRTQFLPTRSASRPNWFTPRSNRCSTNRSRRFSIRA